MMKEPRQKVMSEMGQEACYLLCVVDIAEEVLKERIDAVVAYLEGVERNLVQENCLMTDAAGFLEMLTGVPWVKRYESATYAKKDGEFEVQKWQRKSGAGTIDHFRRETYDPYGDSRTVREGYLESKRIFVRG